MVVEAPIKFALQHQVDGLRQLLDNAGDLARSVRPVLAELAVPTADELAELPLAVNQCHRHAVNLGLDPQVLSSAQPVIDGLLIQQFFQAGMSDRVKVCAS